MKIKCVIDNKGFNNKPSGFEVGKIINRMNINTAKEYSIDEIKQSILQGKTIRPALCDGKENTWQSQQIFMIDIDNKPPKTKGMSDKEYKILCEKYLAEKHRTYQNVIDHCSDINIIPNFVYTSFNHKEDHHKMRLVFVLNKPITDINIARKIQLYLMNIIGDVDEQCKNLNRIYYAGKSIVFDNNNIIDSDKIIELSHDIDIFSPLKSSHINAVEFSPHNNKNIYNNTYIIVGVFPPSNPEHNDTTIFEENNYNIKAISNRDIQYFKDKYKYPKKIFNNNQEFLDYVVKEIDLGEFLEFKYPKSIRCIFHDDNNASAGIFQNEKGDWIYHCFGCGVSYNLINVIEVLGKFKSRPKTYKFIRDIFNLEIQETEWQKEQKEILLENLKVIINGELEQQCPESYNNIKRNIKYLEQMHILALENISTEKMKDSDDNVMFFASIRYIADKMNMSENSIKEISKKNTMFAYHQLINKIDDADLPEDFLKRSKAISINSTEENKKYRHVNCYSIPSYTTTVLSEIEKQGVKWKNNNYSMTGCSREMFFRKEGKEVADWLYPQYKEVFDKEQETIVGRTTNKKSNKRTDTIVELIFNSIADKNYIVEREIVDYLISTGISKKESEKQIKKSLPEILDSYDLKRVRANKNIKEQLGITLDGYPFLIVKSDFL